MSGPEDRDRDPHRFAMQTVVLTYDDGSGISAEITLEESHVVRAFLEERLGTRLVEHAPDATDLSLEECLATGWHLDHLKDDGTCLYCGAHS